MMMMIGHGRISYRLAVVAVVSFPAVSAALGAVDGVPDYDFDWAVIGDPGNKGWSGEIPQLGTGRGAVDYTYRMSKMEVTSAQWREFITAIRPVVGDPRFGAPVHWGYFEIFGEFVDVAPDPDNSPVFGISWHEAAMYANWLHNDKQASIAAISNGAYDISTFGELPNGMFTDQLTRNPDAKFWIPSLDEWIKAAHYDPNKNGPGEGGYWMYPNTSDTAPTPGPPGEGETGAGDFFWEVEGFENLDSRDIPLGSYPETTSPWGLLDVSGGSLEWTEGTVNNYGRITMGAQAGGGTDDIFFSLDRIDRYSGRNTTADFDTTIRIASAVPATGPGAACAIMFTFVLMRRKR